MLTLNDHKFTLIATVLLIIIGTSGVFFEDAFAAVFSPTQPNALVSYNSDTNEVQVEWDYTTGVAPETCLLKGDFWFFTDLDTKFNTDQSQSDDPTHPNYDSLTRITGFIPLHYSVVSSSPTTIETISEVVPCEGEIRIDLDTVMSHDTNVYQDGVTPREDLQIFLSFYSLEENKSFTTTIIDEIFVFYTPDLTWSTAAKNYACGGQIGNTIYIDNSGIHGNNGENCGVYVELNSNQYVDIATDGTQTPGTHTAQSFSLLHRVSSGGSDTCLVGCQSPTMGVNSSGNRIVEGGFTYNEQTVDVERGHTEFPPIIATIGDDNHAIAKVYDNQGISGLRLVQFALGVPAQESPISLSEVLIEVWITYGGDEIEEIIITDKHNLIDNDSIKATLVEVRCSEEYDTDCALVTLHHTYREAPIYQIVKVMVMDIHRNANTSSFNHGVDVLGDSINPADITSTHVPSMLYPQQRGLVELTQIDRAEQLWEDQFGHVWQGDDSKMILISDIPVKPADDDAKSPFTGYNNRINSHFTEYMQEQVDKGIIYFDSSLIQNVLDSTVTHTYPESVNRLDSLADKLKAAELSIIEAYEIKYPGLDRGIDNFEE